MAFSRTFGDPQGERQIYARILCRFLRVSCWMRCHVRQHHLPPNLCQLVILCVSFHLILSMMVLMRR